MKKVVLHRKLLQGKSQMEDLGMRQELIVCTTWSGFLLVAMQMKRISSTGIFRKHIYIINTITSPFSALSLVHQNWSKVTLSWLGLFAG